MFQIKAKVIKNIEVMPDYYKMVLDAPSIAKSAKPGQFVNVLVGDKFEPLLRRPFSIHRISNQKPVTSNQIEILYAVVGNGSEILSQKKSGAYLDVMGPLGNGFSMLDTKYSILVAGGMGIAPLLFLAETTRVQYPASRIQILIGARTKNQILCEKEFKDLSCEVKIATDDGSFGFRGLVTELLKKLLRTIDRRPSTIFACGPKPMLKEVTSISKRYNIAAQVSLEEHMACGIGACFGCVVNTKHGYKRVCKEGPVFDAKEVIL
ncbi:MAG: dihydroorotate dehydrogenase electron transfer subunit [Candidatus Omnitrophica bacterium]|nr:dihydroorotate dehydrogenase electron transfer subunit [Candidatus Omnitrophota bacterium]